MHQQSGKVVVVVGEGHSALVGLDGPRYPDGWMEMYEDDDVDAVEHPTYPPLHTPTLRAWAQDATGS